MPNEIIIKNRAFCRLCSVEVESKSVHDFVSCDCGNLSVDGGREYLRRCFRDESAIVDTSIVIKQPEEAVDERESIAWRGGA